ncbi:MAG: glycine--tRNA ligase subunit beta [Caulobacteraceae bacterium]
MPELLVELFSEEIPARMQSGAARDLERVAADRLAQADLPFERLETFAGPRRLTLVAHGLPARQADRSEERKGPRIGAPEAAVAGFLRSAGVRREDLIERDGVLFAIIARAGRPASEVIAEIIVDIVGAFPWPKSMTWGATRLRWVRPLHRILCVFDGRPVPFALDGLESGDLSEGHRFMGDARPFRAHGFDEYRSMLGSHFVVLDASERKQRILEAGRALCAERGLVMVEDEGLLEEVAGMVEWPTPLLGEMDPAFLSLPPEVIRTTMRVHQRYFAVAGHDGKLAPRFVAVANIEAGDGGALIAAGNARVLAARLADARFFWSEDLKQSLESRLEALKGVIFHAKLGTMYDRARRIEALARAIAPAVGADADEAAAAARLAKADLTTAMVGEFPELQGVMGGYYARAEGASAEAADAIRDHYRPQGPTDWTPSAPISMAVALADKMDTIGAFFSIGETPTGSRDPFGLRRAALGVIRIVLENNVRLPLGELIAGSSFPAGGVIAFFADRLKVSLRERGARHDLVDAVFALGDDDLVRVVARIEALAAFLATSDGANLLVAYKRAGNILAAEARKGPLPPNSPRRVDAPAEEAALFVALDACRPRVSDALESEDFPAALAALASLRGPVDAFFDAVLVNSPVAAERANRLSLLEEVRAIMGQAADFSLVSG